MDLCRKIETAWTREQPATLCERLAFGALTAASAVYGAAAAVRSASFGLNISKPLSINSPVFSIGNLTVGGTGKTPMVMELARMLQHAQRHVAIVTRGYRRKGSSEIVVLNSPRHENNRPNEDDSRDDAAIAGDEAAMMATRLPGVPIVIGPNRRQGALLAERECAADAIILDDGFQHRWLARDCDIVLWDTMRKAETLRLLPRGPLREGLGALSRAHALIFTRANLGYPTRRIIGSIKRRAPHLVIFHTGLEVESLEALIPDCETSPQDLSSHMLSPSSLADLPVAAFCGIGNPDSFWQPIRASGANLVHAHAFADHYRPSAQELDAFEDKSRHQGAQVILLTGKDRQNLPREWHPTLPAYILHTRISWGEDEERFRQFVCQYLDKPREARGGR